MKDYNKDTFLHLLNEKDWNKVTPCDVNSAWSIFKCMFTEVLDVIAPIKQVRLKQRSELWFDGYILNLTNKRDKAWTKFRKHGTEILYQQFKTLRNLTQREVKKAKRNYVRNQIEENSSSPKKTVELGLPSKSKVKNSHIGLKDPITSEMNFDHVICCRKI